MRTYAYRKVHRPYRGEIDQCADRSLSSSTHGERLDRSFARNIFDVPGTAAGRNRTWSWQRKTRAGKRSEAPFITPGCPVRIRRFGSDGLEPEVNQRSEEAADQHARAARELGPDRGPGPQGCGVGQGHQYRILGSNRV